MAGIPAGRLSIEIVAEVARLQQDMDRVRGLVKAASSDIARQAKVANDNLAGIGKGAGAGVQQFSRDVAALKAQLDPAWAAQRRFAEGQRLVMEAFKAGAIDREMLVRRMRELNAELKAVQPPMRNVTALSGQQRAGLGQLAMNLGDVSTQYSMGTKASQIFAQQSGQVIQAVVLLAGETGKFATFMQGPWGIALTAGALILAPFVGKLFEAKEAANDNSKAQETLADKLDLARHSYDEVIAATREYNKEQENARELALAGAAATAREAAANINKAISIRKTLQAQLEAASFDASKLPGRTDAGIVAAQQVRQQNVRDAIAANDNELRALTKSAESAVTGVASEMARLATDPKYAIEQRFKRLRNEAIAAHKDVAAQTRAIADLNREEEAALDRLNKQRREANRLTKERVDLEKFSLPIAGAKVTSGFGARRAPTAGASTFHPAIDLAAPIGTAVHAPQVGTVTAIGFDKGLGKYVVLDHGAGTKSRYGHLSDNTVVSVGQVVQQGDVIAKSGNTGRSTGPHLDYQITVNGKPVDPAKGMFPLDPVRIAEAGEKAQEALQRQTDGFMGKVEDLRAQTDALKALNDRMAAGGDSGAQQIALQQMRDEAELRPLITAAAQAEGEQKVRLLDVLRQYREELARSNEEQARAQALGKIAANGEEIERLRLEATLIGATNRERAVRLAQLEAEQQLRAMPGLSEPDRAAFVQSAKDRAAAQADLADAAEKHSLQLREQVDLMQQLDERARTVADSLGAAFGPLGDTVGTALTVITDRMREQAEIAADLAEAREKWGETDERYTRLQGKLGAEFQNNELKRTAALFGATKKLFNERSAGYKMVEAAEKAASAVALVRTAIHVAKGAAKIFDSLGPFGFPVVAAMLAVMASLGFKGGGSSSYKPPSAEELQKSIGTGTVLGDKTAQSESLGNALGILADNSNQDLEYSNDMVRHLRSIDDGIGALTAQVARQLNLGGGVFDTSSFRLGSTGSSGLLGLIGGGSTTRSLWDQGIEVFQSTVADVLQQGVEAQVYNVIQQVRKSNGFLGIGGSTKTSYQTVTGEVPAEIDRQIKLIVGDVSQSVIAFAQQLGVDVAANVAVATVPAAKLSFKDMNGEEIEAALQAYFSSVADTITAAAGFGIDLSALQKAGEGLYETLARVTRTLMTVNTSLASIGMDSLQVGGNSHVVATAPAADALAAQFGGLDEFQDAVAKFADKFLTEAERMAPIAEAVRAEMDRLGQSGVTTNAQFKALVQSQDLGTEAGRQLFAQLMAVAPAFAKVTDYLGALDGTLAETGKIAQARRALEIQLMEAQGRAQDALNAKRADDVAALDASLQALQQQVYAAQDASRLASLQLRLLNARGDEAGALAFQRTQELAGALSDAERAMLGQVYAAEDLAKAAQAASAAREAEKQAQEEADRAAEEIARQRAALQIELLRAQGHEEQALKLERDAQLAAMDASLRALQQQVWAEQDLAKAREAAAQKVADARGVLTQAYERESGALKDTTGRLKDLRLGLVEAREGLFSGKGFDSFAQLQARYQQTLAAARSIASPGQEAALRDLPGVAGNLRDAMLARSSSRVDYSLAIARMAREIDQAVAASDEAIDFNEAQLEKLDAMTDGLRDVGDKVISVREAVEAVLAAIAEQSADQRQIGVTQIKQGNELNRLLDDVTEGGTGMKAAAA